MAIRFSLPPPVKPLPVIIPICASIIAGTYQNAHLLTGRLIQRHIGTPTRIGNIAIKPLSGTVNVCDVRISDGRHRPLLSFPSISIKFSFPKRRPNVTVTAPSMTVTAVLLNLEGDGPRTNWSQLLETMPEPVNTETPTKAKEEAEESAPFCNYTITVPRPMVTLMTESNRYLLQRFPLPQLYLTSAQITTMSAATHLADDIVARVIGITGAKHFPKEYRKLARRWGRTVAKGVVDDSINWGRTNVTNLRRMVQQVDTVVQDLPGLDPVQVWTGRIDGALGMFHRAISGLTKGQPVTESGEVDTSTNPSANLGSNNNTPVPEAPLQDNRFRELDEECP